MFKNLDEIKVTLYKVMCIVCIIGIVTIIILEFTQPEEKTDVTYNDYVRETINTGEDLTEQIYTLIESGELNEYYRN